MKMLKCRNCGTEIYMSDSNYKKMLRERVKYNGGIVPCMTCTDGAVHNVYQCNESGLTGDYIEEIGNPEKCYNA